MESTRYLRPVCFIFRDYTYCTQVRNPYTRFESMWKHCIRIGLTTEEFYDWGNRTIDGLAVGDWEEACDEEKKELILDYYYSRNDIPSLLFQPQWRWVRSPVKVFKLEDMTIWDYIKLPPIHENNSQKDTRVTSRKIEWSQELREKVYEVYEKISENSDIDSIVFSGGGISAAAVVWPGERSYH